MADSVVKLRIDSKEYDANIKRAGQALTDYFNKVREGGGTLMHLDEGVLEAVKAMGELGTMSGNTKGALRELTQATTDMTAAYRALTDEEKNSPLGQEMAKSIAQMTERAGAARDAMADVAASINNAASDTRGFDQASQGIQLMTSGFQTALGAAKMFGIEIGNEQQVLTMLASAMSVTNGLQTAQNLLQKQSALMMGVSAVQAKALAAAQALAGKETKIATAAQAAFNAVAKANPYVLLASAVAAVGLALVGFSKNAKQATEATNTQTDAMKQAQRMADIWKNTMSSTFAQLMTKYDELKRQWMALKDEHSRTEWIKNNQTALQQLGGAVTDVKTAEDFFNNNTDAVVQSFVRRAQAAARVAQLTELYRKQIELLDKKSQTSAAIAADAQHMGRSAKAGDEITDATYRSSRYGQVNAQGKWVFSEAGAKLYSGTDTSSAQSVLAIDVELKANQNEIDKVKSQITNEFKDVTIVGGGSGGGGSTKTIEKEKDDFEEIIGLIPNAEEAVRSLQQQIRDSWDEGEIATLNTQLKAAEKELQRLKDIGKEVKPAEMATGFSGASSASLSAWLQAQQKSLSTTNYGTADYQSLSANIIDTQTLQNLLNTAIKNGITISPDTVESLFDQIIGGENIPDTTWQSLQDEINAKLKELGIEPIQIDFKKGTISAGKQTSDAESFKKTMGDISQVTNGVSSIVSGVQQLGVEIPDEIGKVLGAINVVTAIMTTIASLVTIISATSSAKAIPVIGWALANGGVVHAANGYVPGNNYSGDMVPAMLNSGELVLNRAQQGNLASQLEGNPLGNLHLETYVAGRSLRIVLNNESQGRLKGKYVTSNKQ